MRHKLLIVVKVSEIIFLRCVLLEAQAQQLTKISVFYLNFVSKLCVWFSNFPNKFYYPQNYYPRVGTQYNRVFYLNISNGLKTVSLVVKKDYSSSFLFFSYKWGTTQLFQKLIVSQEKLSHELSETEMTTSFLLIRLFVFHLTLFKPGGAGRNGPTFQL